MRFIGLVLALGGLTWVLYQAAGGGEAETAIPVEHQKALDTAKNVEQALMNATQKHMRETEKKGDL